MFKKGDVVQLKSGGPRMTIDGTVGTDKFICKWFHDNKVLSETFASDALEIYEELDFGDNF
jgi:uncharacterized protein YodC (DUF2158 family)